ncbi:hypothetical protein E4195_11790 [Pseudomonas putida]|uniref:hypothetical protein n=1 Tax=Pseudomonas putida TaxID=303 RepID=UPI0010751F7C|nr:hypothetical protein [Pseudomonas putida]TFW37629.1 hypothetical protein E4195_11790 [Pseudomonas putida]
MKLENGVYQLVCGNGGGFCVEVRDATIRPVDPGGPIAGVIRVLDRTFTLNRWDEALTINSDQTVQQGECRYEFRLEIFFKASGVDQEEGGTLAPESSGIELENLKGEK